GGGAGVLFRAEGLPDGGVRGYRAGLGADWLELRELQGRGTLASIKTGVPLPDPRGWNRYEIVAKGDRVRAFLNGARWFDLTDPDGARRGIIALQLPSGTGEVRFKDLRLELLK